MYACMCIYICIYERRTPYPPPRLAQKLIEGPVWSIVVLSRAPLDVHVNFEESERTTLSPELPYTLLRGSALNLPCINPKPL